MGISFCCSREKLPQRIQAFFVSGGNPDSNLDYFYAHTTLKFFSIFKKENKTLYLHLTQNHFDEYQHYLNYVFPQYLANFVTMSLIPIYKSLSLIVKNPTRLINDLTLCVGILLN